MLFLNKIPSRLQNIFGWISCYKIPKNSLIIPPQKKKDPVSTLIFVRTPNQKKEFAPCQQFPPWRIHESGLYLPNYIDPINFRHSMDW